MSPSIKIDLFSDPACPWCLVGLYRLNAAIARLSDVKVDVIHHPYFLDANAPLEGQDVVEMLTRKYGTPPDEMWNRLEAEAAKSGLELDMRKQKMRYSTIGAATLIAAARAKGTQNELAWSMSKAYYIDALNMGDVAVLAEIATWHGFTPEEVVALFSDEQKLANIGAQAAEASRQGINGVPFFIFQEMFAMSGAQPDEVFDQALASAVDAAEQGATQVN